MTDPTQPNQQAVNLLSVVKVAKQITTEDTTLVILKIVDWTVGLRVKDEEEVMGLDLSQHGETGYNL